MKWKILTLACCLSIPMGGCATVAFDPPPYSYLAPNAAAGAKPVEFDASQFIHFTTYLRGAIDTFDRLLKTSEQLKYATELPIIAAGIFAPTALALGANPDHAIYAAGVGAAGGALSNYFGVRTRQVHVAQARGAITCINQQYVGQVAQARNLAYSALKTETADSVRTQTLIDTDANSALNATSTLQLSRYMRGAASVVAGDVASAGSIAVAAADEIISRLKVKLASVGQTPDYAAILKDLKDKQALADAREADAISKFAAASAADRVAIGLLAEYDLKIAECLAKFPA